MSILVLQIVIKQWDKSQRSEQDQQARAAIAERYLLSPANAVFLLDDKVIVDLHGKDLKPDRISYALNKEQQLIVDRFRIDLENKTLEYMTKDDSNTGSRLIATLDNDWVQCQYNWRYSVYEGGFYYWLYEEFTLNACFVDKVSDELFMASDPAIRCHDLDSNS